VTIKLNLIDGRMLLGNTMKTFDFEYWSSLDSRYIILTIEAESKTEAIKEFKNRHPHKKYRLLDPLDD
jgi:hypothetical protein